MNRSPDLSPGSAVADIEYKISSDRAENFLYNVYSKRRYHAELDDYLELIEGKDVEFRRAKFKSKWKVDEKRASVIREHIKKYPSTS